MKDSLFNVLRKQFHSELISNNVLTVDDSGVASNADKDNLDSKAISQLLLSQLGVPNLRKKVAAQTLGSQFEKECEVFVKDSFEKLGHLRPGNWTISRPSGKSRQGITMTEQYRHLETLSKACEAQPELAAILGQDYIIKPDIVIIRAPEEDEVINSCEKLVDEKISNLASIRKANGGDPIFHASISCKFTMRSDRAQNSRSEALNLIRNRKGRTPHIVVVTAEPLPSRLASLALGTGDLDCVYHIALPELQKAVNEKGSADSKECLQIMIDGKRLRDISDLPLDLAI